MNQFAEFLSSIQARRPAVVLAPMAGITDCAMRHAAYHFGASLTVSEMVDARYIDVAGARLAQARISDVVQIAGCDKTRLETAARLAEAQGACAVDINMGCPAKKVVGGLAGSALMRDLDHAAALIGAVRKAVTIPVTVKMRLGWEQGSLTAPELARRAEQEGAALVTVHGRTRAQFYNGQADWRAIGAVVAAVSLPVIANGDCRSVEDAAAMLALSGAAGVMVGRAALGRPWIVGDIRHHLQTKRARSQPQWRDRLATAQSHYDDLLHLHGSERGVRHARKHLAAYAIHAGHPADSDLHQALVQAEQPAIVHRLLDDVFSPGLDRAA